MGEVPGQETLLDSLVMNMVIHRHAWTCTEIGIKPTWMLIKISRLSIVLTKASLGLAVMLQLLEAKINLIYGLIIKTIRQMGVLILTRVTYTVLGQTFEVRILKFISLHPLTHL